MRLLAACLIASGLMAAETPTFYKDVLPVLGKRCQECHRQGEAAPMALTTYAESRPWAKAIRAAVLSRKMPPWYANSHYGKFSNDRSLSMSEIDTLAQWADGGAPAGDPKQAPAPASFASGWTIGKPDLILDMGVDYQVPAKGTVEYTYFVVPTGFTKDTWVRDIEVRAGNRAVVHHIVLFTRPKGSKSFAEAKPGVPFVPDKRQKKGERPPQSDKGVLFGLGMDGIEMVGVYVPGGIAYKTRPGQARLIPAGADLIFQMHYTANGTPGADRSLVGMILAPEPPRERVVNAFIMNDSLRIPPGDANHRVDANVTLHADATLQSLFPHMHLRGKAFSYTATYPTGETETLLEVPKYDFNWQLTYYLEKPLPLPKGTVLRATAYYDNSLNNPANPDPQKEVYWGDQSWEEMIAGFVDLAIPVSLDPAALVRAPKPAAKPAAGSGGAGR